MPNVFVTGYRPNQTDGAIPASGTLSESFDLAEHTRLGLFAEDLTVGTLSFQVSTVEDGTYTDLLDSDGAAITIGPLSGTVAIGSTQLAPLAAWRYVKVKMSSTQASQATITFILKA